MESNALMHYGVLGMKWGVRRTPQQLARASGKTKSSDDKQVKESRKQDVKNRRSLSSDEIKKKIDRLKLERELKSLTQEDISPGKKIVSDVLKSAGTKTLSIMAAGATAYAVKAAMTGKFDIKEAAQYIAANPNKKK